MQDLIRRLEQLKGDPRHRFASPANPETLAAARAEFPTFPDELAELYAFADGFELFVDDEFEAQITFVPCSEINPHSVLLGLTSDPSHPYDYECHGDPERLHILVSGNEMISFSCLGFKTGRWLFEFEGLEGIIGATLPDTLNYILDSDDGEHMSMGARWDMPHAYNALVKKLHEEEKERAQKWFAAQQADPASDWSDL